MKSINAEPVGRNLTLVAFFDSKPDSLVQLVDMLQTGLRLGLGSAFSAYTVEQVHATIVGLEGWRIGAQVFNANMVQINGKLSTMDLRGLFRYMQEITPFQIRIGGFAAQKTYPFASRGLHPYIRSTAINGSLAVVMGWPVAGEAYPMTLDSLRRECAHYNVLHKYHQKEDDIDNDFFLVLGQVARGSISDDKVEHVQDSLRQHLANAEPLDLVIQPEDLAVVTYTDARLPAAGSVRYSLSDAIDKVEELILLYGEDSTI
jgi:hypothetical protein